MIITGPKKPISKDNLSTFSACPKLWHTNFKGFLEQVELRQRNDRAMEYLSRKAAIKRDKRNQRWENIFCGMLALGAILFMILCFFIAAARGAIVWAT